MDSTKSDVRSIAEFDKRFFPQGGLPFEKPEERDAAEKGRALAREFVKGMSKRLREERATR